MKFIKQRFLSMRARNIAEQNKLPRRTLNYRDAKRIGIAYQADGVRPELIGQFIDRLKKEGKQVEVLAFFQQRPQEQAIEIPFFSHKDVTLFGRIESPAVARFVSQEFDYLYCISEAEAAALEQVMALSKAKCRVGRYLDNSMLYELMIQLKPEQGLDHLVEEMMRYTKAIANN
jgi:hypothetical protein